ncbi:short chain dehydrogenase [Salinisphaera sp. PC39]|uniref:SDR family oxidoreductase n=1 Tax=Salinisphaera sp. PC39 TaxID=1304156 RepID=UPI003342DD0B
MNRFPEKRVAITGAGSGLGRALALRFAREDWRVAVTDRDAEAAARVAGEVEAAGGEAFAQRLDVTREADFSALIDRLRDEWGGVDVFVNNAGVGSAGTVTEGDMAEWERQLDINLLGVVRGCRAAVPLLREGGGGHVINIASFAAIASAPGMAAYNAAKAGVLSLSETLRGEVHDDHIGVSVACPAFFATNILDSFESPDPAQKAMVKKVMEKSEVGAEDVAADLYRAAMEDRFLVISHGKALWQYRMKRLAPERFFHEVRKAMRPFVAGTKNSTEGSSQ